MRFVLLGLAVSLAGCAVDTGNVGAARDAGRDGGRGDSAIVDGGAEDAGTDAATEDDAGTDAAPAIDAGTDAAAIDSGRDGGRDAATVTPPVVDGVIGSTEWAGAPMGSNATATIWAGDELMTLRALAVSGTLYVAVEGRIEGGNAIVLYVDGDPGGTHGVADLAALTDSSAGLDDALSAGFTQPTGSRADVAWGTTLMSHVASASDTTTGFRDIASNVADFAWLTGAPTTCTATACEASVATSALGPGPAPRTITLFARITNATGFVSPNQTLPMDDASMPRVVTAVLTVHE